LGCAIKPVNRKYIILYYNNICYYKQPKMWYIFHFEDLYRCWILKYHKTIRIAWKCQVIPWYFSLCTPPSMAINQANAPSRGQRHLYGCTQNLCVFSACKCINQELFLRDSVCVSMEGSGRRGECSGRTQDTVSRIQDPVQCKCVNLQFWHRAQPETR